MLIQYRNAFGILVCASESINFTYLLVLGLILSAVRQNIMSAQGLIVSLCKRTLRLYLQISFHTLTVSSRCCQSCAGLCILAVYTKVSNAITFIALFWLFLKTLLWNSEHRNDQEIAGAKENRQKQWKALRQVPDADEDSSRPSNIEESSPASKTQSDQPNFATINRLGPPSLAPRRSKRLKGEAPSHTGVDKF